MPNAGATVCFLSLFTMSNGIRGLSTVMLSGFVNCTLLVSVSVVAQNINVCLHTLCASNQINKVNK